MADEQKERDSLKIRRLVEEVTDFPERRLLLEGIVINGEHYDLGIINEGNRLSLEFYMGGTGKSVNLANRSSSDFSIQILEDYIGDPSQTVVTFNRHMYRPYHDHDDDESLQVGLDDSVMGVTKGALVWRKDFPHRGRGYGFFSVPFGAVNVDY